MTQLPTLHDVYQARALIKPIIFKTPLLESAVLADKSDSETVHFKLECLQKQAHSKPSVWQY